MEQSSLKVLLVEDNTAQAELVEEILAGLHEPAYNIEHVTRIGAAESRLQAGRFDVILLDLHLPDSDGPAGVERVLREAPVTPIIVLTNIEDEQIAAQCVRDGAQDYLLKREVETRALTRAIRYAIERVRADHALRESEQRFALAVAGANDGLWDWDLVNDAVYYSPRWKSIIGYGEGELGQSIDEWFGRIHDDDRISFRSALSAHLDGRTEHFEHEHRLHTKDGIELWVLCRGLAIRDEDGQASRVAGSLTDISQRKHAEEQLIHDALHDALTTLPNRALFMDRLDLALKRFVRNEERLFAVLFFDLDRFKTINDSLGHVVGDELLRHVARRVEKFLRPGDTLARLGGDEFAILINDVSESYHATHVAERVHELLREVFIVHGHEIYTSASVGIALSTLQYDRPEEIIRDADLAMYRAKTSGHARYEVFDSAMHESALALHRLETDLRRGVDGSEFALHYQPIVSLESSRIMGFEALLRWNHPQWGLVNPDYFIDVAEETGLIVPIGWWVLRESAKQARIWQDMFPMDPPLSMSVNVPGKLIVQPDMVKTVAADALKAAADAYAMAAADGTDDQTATAESAVNVADAAVTAAAKAVQDAFIAAEVERRIAADAAAKAQAAADEALEAYMAAQIAHIKAQGAHEASSSVETAQALSDAAEAAHAAAMEAKGHADAGGDEAQIAQADAAVMYTAKAVTDAGVALTAAKTAMDADEAAEAGRIAAEKAAEAARMSATTKALAIAGDTLIPTHKRTVEFNTDTDPVAVTPPRAGHSIKIGPENNRFAEVGSAVHSIGGWFGRMFSRSDAETGTTETVNVYTDVEAPTPTKFAEVYDLVEGEDHVTADTDDVSLLQADDFPSDANGVKTYLADDDTTPVDESTRTFRGTFDGAEGEFECTDGPCTAGNNGKGELISLAGTWTFTPDKDVTVDVADKDYLQFGYWIQTTEGSDGTTAYDFDAFSGGKTPVSTARDFDDGNGVVMGSATYKGPAGGMYVRKMLDAEGGVMSAMHGNFTADAELKANFGGPKVAADSHFTVSGTVKKFMDGMTPLSGWSVNLVKTDNFATPDDTTTTNSFSGVTEGMTDDIAGAGGNWNGKFYGGADEDVVATEADERIPTGMAGEFDAHFSNGHVNGAFGAVQQ